MSSATSHYTRRSIATLASAIVGVSVVLPGATLLSSGDLSSSSRWHSLGNQFHKWKAHKIGHYQNRIRSYSHPHKVFQYFATVNKNGTEYMTPYDFIRSLQRYIENVDGQEIDHRYRQIRTQSAVSFFKLADTNGDGLIDFNEYMFFTSLLLIPQRDFEHAFQTLDADGNGVLTRQEFTKFLDDVYDSTTFYTRMGRREHDTITSRQCHGILNLFFGPDGKQNLHILEFLGFMQQLRLEVLKLEFYNLPVDLRSDTIDVREMAAQLIGYAELPIIHECSRRLIRLPEYPDRVSFSEFVKIHDVASRMDDIALAVVERTTNKSLPATQLDSAITPSPISDSILVARDQLNSAIHLATGYVVKPSVIDALFRILKNEDDDTIDFKTFENIVGHRQTMGLDTPRDIEFSRWLTHLVNGFWTLVLARI